MSIRQSVQSLSWQSICSVPGKSVCDRVRDFRPGAVLAFCCTIACLEVSGRRVESVAKAQGESLALALHHVLHPYACDAYSPGLVTDISVTNILVHSLSFPSRRSIFRVNQY
jgi:hypothetical protein